MRYLETLGLRRRVSEAPDLGRYLAERYGGGDGRENVGTDADQNAPTESGDASPTEGGDGTTQT